MELCFPNCFVASGWFLFVAMQIKRSKLYIFACTINWDPRQSANAYFEILALKMKTFSEKKTRKRNKTFFLNFKANYFFLIPRMVTEFFLLDLK